MNATWLIASGKGGVGKSSLACALALHLARGNNRVLLIDADVGLRGLDLLLGLQDQVFYELADCLQHQCALQDAMVRHPSVPNLSLLAAGQFARPRDFAPKDLRKILQTLKNRFDIILIDGPAGIGRGLKNFLGACDAYIVVATPDPVCLRDAQTVENLILQQTHQHPYLLLNRFDRGLAADEMIQMPEQTAQTLDMPLLGVVEESQQVYAAMLRNETMATCGDVRVQNEIGRIASRMLGLDAPMADLRLSRWERFTHWLDKR